MKIGRPKKGAEHTGSAFVGFKADETTLVAISILVEELQRIVGAGVVVHQSAAIRKAVHEAAARVQKNKNKRVT